MDEFKLFNKVGYYQGGHFHFLLTDLINPIWNIFFFDDIGKIIFLLYILHGNYFHFCMRTNPLVIGVSALVEKSVGCIAQIIGPVLDVSFPPGYMPNIYNSLTVKGEGKAGQEIQVTCEVQQLLGNHKVRAVAMSATDGLTRGMIVIDTGAPLSVPVGGATLGRIFNVLGEPVDNLGPVDARITSPIHRPAPTFTELDTKLSIFETGIKVVDLLAPYRRGGKNRFIWRSWSG